MTTESICTNVAGCPCITCGQVRLLFAHEQQRQDAAPCAICASDAMRAELVECPLCGAPGLLSEIDALAEKFITDYLNRQG